MTTNAVKILHKRYGRRGTTRLIVMSDTHCGHVVGLTPPGWWYEWETRSERQKRINTVQRELWGWFSGKIDELKPIDKLFCVGDMINGKDSRWGGTQSRTNDRAEQAEMAAACINYVGAKKILMIYGTPYHTGCDEDWENEILAHLECKDVIYAGQEWPEINGLVFDIKHFVGGSSIPHGKWTALARDKLWNIVWNNEHDLQPSADVLIRAHVHYHIECSVGHWRAMTCPMLMGYGDKYGVRKCSRDAQIGFLVFDIAEDGNYTWWPVKAELPHQKARTLPF